jgi:hypothetical protein
MVMSEGPESVVPTVELFVTPDPVLYAPSTIGKDLNKGDVALVAVATGLVLEVEIVVLRERALVLDMEDFVVVSKHLNVVFESLESQVRDVDAPDGDVVLIVRQGVIAMLLVTWVMDISRCVRSRGL